MNLKSLFSVFCFFCKAVENPGKMYSNSWYEEQVFHTYQVLKAGSLRIKKADPEVKEKRAKSCYRSGHVTVNEWKNPNNPYQDKSAVISIDIVNLGNQKKAGSKKEGWEQNQGRTRLGILLIFVFKMIASVMYAYCASSKQQNLNAISDLNGLLFVQLLLVC